VIFHLWIKVEKTAGPDLPEEDVLDFFCGVTGRENGARPPLKFTIPCDGDEEKDSEYEVVLVDDQEIKEEK
jgi:hypothetical protein